MGAATAVHWCPSCRGWTRSATLNREAFVIATPPSRMDAEALRYVRKARVCADCDTEFVTVKPPLIDCADVWRASNALNDAQMAEGRFGQPSLTETAEAISDYEI